jgi:hypothetical protein
MLSKQLALPWEQRYRSDDSLSSRHPAHWLGSGDRRKSCDGWVLEDLFRRYSEPRSTAARDDLHNEQ